MSRVVLKLYITGRTTRSERAIRNLRTLCENKLGSDYKLEIIDVLEHPQLAESDKILATPTLIRETPPPLRRIIGDLSDQDKVLRSLDLVGPNGWWRDGGL